MKINSDTFSRKKRYKIIRTVLCSVTCQTEFTPMTYVYYSERRNWNDANQTCAQTDGMLALFPDISTVMDILEELPAIK